MSRALRGVRFRPPRFTLHPAHRWLLRTAFSTELPDFEDMDAGLVVSLIRVHSLGARIGARWPDGLPDEILAGILAARRRALVIEMVFQETARVVADAAQAIGARVVLLKFLALQETGALLPGSREAGDVDVLVEEESRRRFQEALLSAGFEPSVDLQTDHHSPPLRHPDLGLVEIHRHIPGVRAPGSRPSIDLSTLEREGQLAGSTRFGEHVAIPSRPILLAHLLAHGLAQHGLRPQSYPLMRTVADLIDLGFGPESAGSVGPWLDRTLSPEEVRATATLCRQLAQGDLTAACSPGTPEGRLLFHILAAPERPSYLRRLKLREPWYSAGSKGAAWKRLLWLSDDQIDVVYGRQGSPWRYWLYRIWRPFDLVLRAIRAHRREP